MFASNRLFRFLLVGCVIFCFLLVGTSITHAEQRIPKGELKRVRVIYLVSADREEKKEYTAAIEHAILDLQKWYARQLNGPTFRLRDPVVEVVKSQRAAKWFYGNPNGPNKDSWGFNNTLAEAKRLVGAKFRDPNFIWVIYSDGPGNKGRGGSGVTCLPEDDLLGLVGKHPTQKNKLRWIAGLGHEVGHAFGLMHPADTTKDRDAIMWTGIYERYPDRTYLTTEDKQILRQSPFFYHKDNTPILKKGKVVARFEYSGGEFRQHAGEKTIYWTESKTKGKNEFTFVELKRDDQFVYILDPTRRMNLKVPVNGGRMFFSNDGQKTWRPLYELKKAKSVE